jgi:hypothetical protein
VRSSETSGVDERHFGGGELIGVEAAAAEMGAAPSGVDVVVVTKSCVREE